jgi:hypothetical protein
MVGRGRRETPLAYMKFAKFHKELWTRVHGQLENRVHLKNRKNGWWREVMAEESPCALRVLECWRCDATLRHWLNVVSAFWGNILSDFTYKLLLGLATRSFCCCFAAQLLVFSEPSDAGVPNCFLTISSFSPYNPKL